ncbi:hypothetical protein SAMN05421803_1523 [Nocardiopsis flavescens]|uniref:Uncharacterized protein n=1 Tax=Nocardiopsis flavescens TaxID=758803 RepID=A0A1M6WVA3_9ACTN|nr:hypothetical protein [Nocardiopsis flavescens]SHK97677.1 hypothetical protein SAMN05421803_1523 [Nocardiopsis flavescens]
MAGYLTEMAEEDPNYFTPGDAMYQAITGRAGKFREGKTHGKWARDAIRDLGGTGRGGGVRRLAEKMGVSTSTVRRWAKSKDKSLKGISPDRAEALKKAQRETKIDKGHAQGFRDSFKPGGGGGGGAGGSLTVTGIFVVSQDERERTINLGHHLPGNAGDKLIQAYLDGGPEGARDMLNALISAHYVTGMYITAINDIGW